MARTAVVTGGSAGIGLATAHHLAASGWDVAIIARDQPRLDEAKQDLERKSGRVLAISADVADAKAVDAAADRIEAELGPIEAWINNAMSTVLAPAHEITPKEWERVTATTYLSQVYGTLAALRHMRGRRRGSIIQVSSGLAIRAIPMQSAYCAAKFAVSGFTDSLRAELKAEQLPVTLTVVYLPGVDTPQPSWSRNRMGREQIIPGTLADPRLCAQAIVSAIDDPQREIWVGRSTVAMAIAQALSPSFADGKAASMGDAQKGKPMPDREGNLFEPVAGPARIDGGSGDRVSDVPREWFTTRSRTALKLGLALGLLGLGAVAGRSSERRRRRIRGFF